MRTQPRGFLSLALAAAAAVCLPPSISAQPADSLTLLRLERAWNEAHVRDDTATLSDLWADDIMITVPEMAPMSKADVLRFWRSGRSVITRYETSDLKIHLYGDAAVVSGRLRRERNFNGQVINDDWWFTKLYVRRGDSWRVVAYQATVSAG